MTTYPSLPAVGLSLRQPWAHAVVHLGKGLENRKWRASFRGPVLLHASGTIGNRGDFHDACEILSEHLDELDWVRFRDEHLGITMAGDKPLFVPRSSIALGGIIGVARIVDVLAPCAPPAPRQIVKTHTTFRSAFQRRCAHKWHAPEQYAFVLRDIEPLPFVSCKGALSFFPVASEVVSALEKKRKDVGT